MKRFPRNGAQRNEGECAEGKMVLNVILIEVSVVTNSFSLSIYPGIWSLFPADLCNDFCIEVKQDLLIDLIDDKNTQKSMVNLTF